jgi:hypothetical protein
MQKFKTVAYLLLGYFWLVEGLEEDLVEIKGFLATAEVSAGAVAKADQQLGSSLA